MSADVIPISKGHEIRARVHEEVADAFFVAKLHLAGPERYPCGAADCLACGEEHVHDFISDPIDWALSANPCKPTLIIGDGK